MTDPGTADRTYIGPMSAELVEEILDKVRMTQLTEVSVRMHHCCTPCHPECARLQERPDAVLPTMGGQTSLNLAKALSEVNMLGNAIYALYVCIVALLLICNACEHQLCPVPCSLHAPSCGGILCQLTAACRSADNAAYRCADNAAGRSAGNAAY